MDEGVFPDFLNVPLGHICFSLVMSPQFNDGGDERELAESGLKDEITVIGHLRELLPLLGIRE